MAHDTAMGSGIDAALDCHTVCLETITHCLTNGGDHARPDHIKLLLDCAEICQTAGNFMTRESEVHALTCEACAEICERCAASCEAMGDDEMMRRCAEACRRCAESCRHMAGAA